MDAVFTKLMEDMVERLERIGLYTDDPPTPLSTMNEEDFVQSMSEGKSVKDLSADGSHKFAFSVVTRIGSLAWDDRSLRPDDFEASKVIERLDYEMKKEQDERDFNESIRKLLGD